MYTSHVRYVIGEPNLIYTNTSKMKHNFSTILPSHTFHSVLKQTGLCSIWQQFEALIQWTVQDAQAPGQGTYIYL